MIIQVPKWVSNIKDNHLALFGWFCYRMSHQYGFDTQYSIHIDDVGKITNKRREGLVSWIRRCPIIDDNITLGHLYDEVVVFTIKKPDLLKSVTKPILEEPLYDYELTEERSRLVYMYILGCLNKNLIGNDDLSVVSAFRSNTFGVKPLYVNRKPQAYIKQCDRVCKEED